MPLLDIATVQSSLRNNLFSIGFQRIHHASFVSGYQTSASWRYFRLPHTIQMSRARLMIKAVATLEPRCSDKEGDNAPTDDDEPPIQDEKERLRRKRISNANKGRQAWNKGRKHSPETRQKIRDRTRLAMRTPKVKMKLLKGIHSQSRETRLRIAAAVRLTWDKRRSNRELIVRCHHEWRNLIAEASRKGVFGEEELQWDSYEIQVKQLEKEFEEGLESRKKKRSSNPGARAPKTLEQRKKISEAIAAKWADPGYRDRVYSGIAKKRGIEGESRDPEWGMKKKKKEEAKRARGVRKREEGSSRIRSPPRPKLKTKEPSAQTRYKDPQARYKLEMIKSIRAQRAASDPKITEAILRANVLIGEAQRAAEALEAGASKSRMAEASLVETRKLIAEAISYIKSIETGGSNVAMEDGAKEERKRKVNGVRGGLSDAEIAKFGELGLNDEDEDEDEEVDVVANGREHIDLASTSTSSWGLKMKEVEAADEDEDAGAGAGADTETEGERKMASEEREQGVRRRRWVCGRLVEDQDE